MVLQDAGVRRAKLGDVEVEFSEPEVVGVRVEQGIITLPQRAQPSPATDRQGAQHPGYASLFGENTPKFKPVGEG